MPTAMPALLPTSRSGRWFDVNAALDTGEPLQLAATIVAPDQLGQAPSGVVLVCSHGAGYTRRYWTKAYGEGSDDFGTELAARGHIVVAVDNLGMGESSVPADPDTVDLESMGRALAIVIDTVRAEARDGTLLPGLDPIDEPRVVLVGHSMGGAVTIVSQAQNSAADAVAILGTTTLELAGLVPDGADDPGRTEAEHRAFAMEYRAPLLWGRPWSESEQLMSYDRVPFRPIFYFDDVPESVMVADEADGSPTPRMALLECATPPLFRPRAAEIEQPVFLGFGERDLSPDPGAEVAAFSASPDITLFRLAASAHCHNLAGTRIELWDRLGRWAGALA